jgi:hypothetical protein
VKAARAMSVAFAVTSLVAAGSAPAGARAPRPCASRDVEGPGKGAPLTVITPKATTDAPQEIEVRSSAGAGLPGDETSTTAGRTYANIQLDPKSAKTTFSVRLGFWAGFDHDLYVRDASGAVVASSTGLLVQNNPELVEGISARDCDVFTIEVVTTLGPGADVALGNVDLFVWMD